ncbi:MAG: protein-glutamate methylesterase/protein-glutamine glutaminase [Bacillota bacterium]
MKKVKVLVVEDSALMRRIIGDIIRDHHQLELLATARDGLDALDKIKSQKPDVITMDLEMPRMGGLEALKKIMSEVSLPVIMISSHTSAGSDSTLKALDAGAVDFIAKPDASSEESLDELRSVLPQKIIAASTAKVGLVPPEHLVSPVKTDKPAGPGIFQHKAARVILAIGSSTGGPKALEAVFKVLPVDLPASVLLSQHMPPGFTLSFSQRLNMLSALQVKEAKEGDPLLAGQALVAPGGFHLVVKNNLVHLDTGPKVNYVRPSVDVMLESLAGCEQRIMTVIMTGMGKDGAAGARLLKEKKTDTVLIAQSPSTSLIPSMPGALIKSDQDVIEVPLAKMASEIDRRIRVMA